MVANTNWVHRYLTIGQSHEYQPQTKTYKACEYIRKKREHAHTHIYIYIFLHICLSRSIHEARAPLVHACLLLLASLLSGRHHDNNRNNDSWIDIHGADSPPCENDILEICFDTYTQRSLTTMEAVSPKNLSQQPFWSSPPPPHGKAWHGMAN